MLMPASIKLPDGYKIIECEKCGCCYADTPASPEDYDSYYSEHNYYGANWKYNSSTEFDLAVTVKLLKKFFSKDSLIIDMGCGNGKLLKKLSQENFSNIVGVDPSFDSVKALTDLGIRAYLGSIYERGSEEIPKADVVILSMVLEHLLEPIAAIESLISNYLKINGAILVTWPHFEDLMIDDSVLSNNFNHEHINYFGKNQVDILFSRVNFVSKDYHISIGSRSENFISFSNVALYEKNISAKNFNFEKDHKTAHSILEYIERSEKSEQKIIEAINSLAHSSEEIAIWGSGAYLYRLMATSRLKECNLKFIVDNNKLKQEKSIYDLEVKAPEAIKNFRGTVLVVSTLYGREIERQIREMGNDVCKIVHV